jgi:hypothetical protein
MSGPLQNGRATHARRTPRMRAAGQQWFEAVLSTIITLFLHATRSVSPDALRIGTAPAISRASHRS